MRDKIITQIEKYLGFNLNNYQKQTVLKVIDGLYDNYKPQ